MPPLEDLALLAATVGFLYWLAGRLIDDCLDDIESKYLWTRAWGHEDLGRDEERPAA